MGAKMFKIIWKKEYNTNVREIDEQHQHLVHLINVLLAERAKGESPAALKKILVEIIDYTKYHFKTEEEHMVRHQYEHLEEHKANHRTLVDQIVALLNELKGGKSLSSEDLLTILRNWLINHIEKEDLKYSMFLGQAKRVIS